MKRCGAALLMVIGMVVLAPPAFAAVTISVHAGRSTLMAGTATTISGTAYGAKPGSVVRLQRRVGTTWTTVASRKVWSARTYGFSVSPPRGYQYYRVAKFRQFGQPFAVSPTLKLTVRWNPAITASATYGSDPNQGQIIQISGKVTSPPIPAHLYLERKDARGWTVVASMTVDTGGPYQYALRHAGPSGPSYRVRLASTALTNQQVTRTFAYSATPQTMAMNSSIAFANVGPSTNAAAIAEVSAKANDYVTVASQDGGTAFQGTVVSPSGQQVATFDASTPLVRFTAPEPGTYTIDISQVHAFVSEFDLTVSIPQVLTTSIDAPAVTGGTGIRGQQLDVRFDTTGTPTFTVPVFGVDTLDTLTVLDPSGTPVQPWIPGKDDREPVYKASGGVYTFRITPDVNVDAASIQPLSVTTVSGTVDGAATNAVVDVPQRVVVVEFQRPAAKVTLGVGSYGSYNDPIAGMYDAVTSQPNPPGPGNGVVAVAAARNETGTIPIQLSTAYALSTTVDGPTTPVDLTPSYEREVAITFPATAGQIVAPEVVGAGYYWVEGLTGPDGNTITNGWSGAAQTAGAWKIPADGTYTLTLYTVGDWQANVGIQSVETMTIPSDGTPTRVRIDKPGAVVVARIPLAPGSADSITIDDVSNSLGANWSVDIYTPGADWPENSRLDFSPGLGTMSPIVGTGPGDIVAIITAPQAGSLRLTFAPYTG